MLSKRERNRQAQQERILQAAFLLFASKGFDEVTMAEVAQRAGVSRATVFSYYPSKRALVDAITGEVMAYWEGMLDRALDEVETPVPVLLRALLDHMGTRIEQFELFNRSVFREISKFQAGIDEGTMAQASRKASNERLTKLILRGQERDELSRDYTVDDLVVTFSSLFNGVIIHWLFEDSSEPLRVRMRRAADIFLGPVGRPEASMPWVPLPDLAPPDIQPPEGSELDALIRGDQNDDD